MVGWNKIFIGRKRRALAVTVVTATALMLSACGGNPYGLPAPAGPYGYTIPFCASDFGTQIYTGQYTGSLSQAQSWGSQTSQTGAIAASIYDKQPNASISPKSIVANISVTIPQLRFQNAPQTSQCASTKSWQTGISTPGTLTQVNYGYGSMISQVQFVATGAFQLPPWYNNPMGGYPGSYGQPTNYGTPIGGYYPPGSPGYGQVENMEVKVGSQYCGGAALLSNGHIQGCVEVSIPTLGVNLQLWSQ